ncbi:MAG: sulfatase-like hydrolase/transferase, partial [Rickettsiales bacterium]|nr:sulfatase-like hydrolase/transferase [Rickettsiales bacterium]
MGDSHITRRTKTRRLLARASLFALIAASAWALNARFTDQRPNILFIVADDLGWGDVGWHNGIARTPHMNALVHEGVELNWHYVYPSCTPTRTALMTGRYPGRFGPQALSPTNLRAMPLHTFTLASMLKSMGYHTYMAGKWGMGSRPEWGPQNYGFDHSYGTLAPAADPWGHAYRPGAYTHTWHRDGNFITETGNVTELVADEAVRRVRQGREPWFLYVPFHAVHTPVDAPEKYKQRYRNIAFHPNPRLNESRLRLAAMVSQLDDKVGELVTALNQTGQRDRTLIIFTSDNGGVV